MAKNFDRSMQITSRLFMIEPVSFGFNEQTAASNTFQEDTGQPVQQQALLEFHDFVLLLRKNQLQVTVIKDTDTPVTPDAIFPNNWISFHGDGTVVFYPMLAPNRRLERKQHTLSQLEKIIQIERIVDLTHLEEQEVFLEGTGSMVSDRVNKIVYACLSPRTNPAALAEFCKITGYESVVFSATDGTGKNIYHTNVMMCIAENYAVICLDVVADDSEKDILTTKLTLTGKDIIEITRQQVKCFAGNMLQVVNTEGEKLLIMSTQAYLSLTTVQLLRLEKYNRIIHASLDHIETAGGGSARCMIAEIFTRDI